MRGIVPRDKILVQSLSAFSRPDGIVFLFIHTEIVRFSFERDLCAPSSGAPVPVNAGHVAGVGGAQPPSVCFQNGNGRTLAELEIFQNLLFLQAAAAFPVARRKLMQRRVNFPAAVTDAVPDRGAGGIPRRQRVLRDQMPEALTGDISLPRLDICIAAAVRDGYALQSACVEQNFSSAVTAAAPDGVAIFVLNTRAYLPPQRAYLQRILTEAGCFVCPSDANYLLFQGPVGLDDALRKEKIAIRSCANYPGLGPGWYRIAVRLQAENEAFAAALQRCM